LNLPSEFRAPYSAALSTCCLQLLQQCEHDGCTDEAVFVWQALKCGQTLEAVGCNLGHMMTSSLVAAAHGKLWTVTPTHGHRTAAFPVPAQSPAVTLPLSSKRCVFVSFDDSVHPAQSIATSVAAALPISTARFEELLADAAQSLLQQSSINLSTLASSMKDTHGSLPRSIFELMSGFKTSRSPHEHGASSGGNPGDAAPPHAQTCPMCVLMGDDNPIAFYNSCGHGLCRDCWKQHVAAAIANSSTPAVKSGEDLTGAVTVLTMRCSADLEGKCRANIDFGVLCKAVPHMIQPFIRSTMSNLSRLLLSGGAGTCQCACGAVVSGVRHINQLYIISHFLTRPPPPDHLGLRSRMPVQSRAVYRRHEAIRRPLWLGPPSPPHQRRFGGLEDAEHARQRAAVEADAVQELPQVRHRHAEVRLSERADRVQWFRQVSERGYAAAGSCRQFV